MRFTYLSCVEKYFQLGYGPRTVYSPKRLETTKIITDRDVDSSPILATIRFVRHKPTLWAIALAVGSMTGCDAIANLRAMFHPEEQQPDKVGKAGLRVDVEPETGITILLDGDRVATESPYVNESLTAGTHRLEVRGMGFQSLTLPVHLENRQLVTVPVKLLPRAISPAERKVAPTPSRNVPPPDPPPPPAPILPPGVEPIALSAMPKPQAAVLLDHQSVDPNNIILERVHGTLAIGDLTLLYRVGGAGLLTLLIADDGAQWFKHRTRLEGGGQIKLHRGAVRIRRAAPDGSDQTVILRRQ
ncbi:MAG: hypothetical protein A2289_11980 [Deltaproteobacteria bacterium RIFOXYA12_FULL_58_15]|nr:MAG: hypothetical protein A2289_11980 [Deltaproteobacteria bacterium RIFOXYA12_FULL_58_15]